VIAQRPVIAAPATRDGRGQLPCFFRSAASLDVDKQDLERFSDFVNRKLYDLPVRGVENARANGP
jgi:hypothetical protein